MSNTKKNVFLIKHKDFWFEPLFHTETRFFVFDDALIKKLINSKFLVERLDCDFTNEKDESNFIVGKDDLLKYIPIPNDDANDININDDANDINNINDTVAKPDVDIVSDDLNCFEENDDIFRH